jgi:hypothetical protein
LCLFCNYNCSALTRERGVGCQKKFTATAQVAVIVVAVAVLSSHRGDHEMPCTPMRLT